MEPKMRVEHDTMGEVLVPKDAFWGAQTQRSLENFPIGIEKMPREIIRAFALVKAASARANARLGVLDAKKCDLICQAADEILQGKLDGNFPLAVWQTGSGTQSNMNVNEVIAHRAGELSGASCVLHPNDDVNRSQSSNDTFPTALSVAAALAVHERLIPAAKELIGELRALEERSAGIVKSGRTHLMDAVPISFSQEVMGWRGLVEAGVEQLEAAMPGLLRLALGGTAVGTGLNAPSGFDAAVAEELARATGLAFETDPNKFRALTGKEAVVFAHGAVKGLAANLMKVANDVRWLASGPRCGLGEIRIPENEPGSSIMPGKVNPTQAEAVTMVAVQVMGNDAAIGFAASQGNFELNVFMPVIAYNFLQSAGLLADAMRSFTERCVSGIEADAAKMKENLERSLMLVTCLNPHIGYERAAQVAKKAHAEGTSLKDACLALGFMDAEEFDRVFRPEEMV